MTSKNVLKSISEFIIDHLVSERWETSFDLSTKNQPLRRCNRRNEASLINYVMNECKPAKLFFSSLDLRKKLTTFHETQVDEERYKEILKKLEDYIRRQTKKTYKAGIFEYRKRPPWNRFWWKKRYSTFQSINLMSKYENPKNRIHDHNIYNRFSSSVMKGEDECRATEKNRKKKFQRRIHGAPLVLKMKPDPVASRGEAERIVNQAARLLYITETYDKNAYNMTAPLIKSVYKPQYRPKWKSKCSVGSDVNSVDYPVNTKRDSFGSRKLSLTKKDGEFNKLEKLDSGNTSKTSAFKIRKQSAKDDEMADASDEDDYGVNQLDNKDNGAQHKESIVTDIKIKVHPIEDQNTLNTESLTITPSKQDTLPVDKHSSSTLSSKSNKLIPEKDGHQVCCKSTSVIENSVKVDSKKEVQSEKIDNDTISLDKSPFITEINKEKSGENSVEKSIERSAENSVKSAEKSVEKSTEISPEKSVEKSTEILAEKSVEKSMEKSVEKSMEKSAEKSMEKSEDKIEDIVEDSTEVFGKPISVEEFRNVFSLPKMNNSDSTEINNWMHSFENEANKNNNNNNCREQKSSMKKNQKPQIQKYSQKVKPIMNNHNFLIKVMTGDRIGASTNATVWLHIAGSKNKLPRAVKLARSKSHSRPFKRGSTDIFRLVSSRDLGFIQTIQIGHNSNVPGSDWFLEKVEILDLTRQLEYIFPCYRWLSVRERDNKTRVVLECQNNSHRPLMEIPKSKSFIDSSIQCSTEDLHDVIVWDGTNRIHLVADRCAESLIKPQKFNKTTSSLKDDDIWSDLMVEFSNVSVVEETSSCLRSSFNEDDDRDNEITNCQDAQFSMKNTWLSQKNNKKPMQYNKEEHINNNQSYFAHGNSDSIAISVKGSNRENSNFDDNNDSDDEDSGLTISSDNIQRNDMSNIIINGCLSIKENLSKCSKSVNSGRTISLSNSSSQQF